MGMLHRYRVALGWVLLVALGLNLRPILSSVSPLLAEIRLATGMSFQTASLLTTLPVVCMGLVALLAVRIDCLLGERRGIALGLALIFLASLVRGLHGQSFSLLATALVGGAGVALIQALLPAVIKRKFQGRVPVAMGIYSASLMGGGGLAALLSPLAAEHFQHWQTGLGIWLVPALLAWLLWLWLADKHSQVSNRQPSVAFYRQRRAWLLALYFGLINAGYTSMVAWLPAYYLQLGWSPTRSGSLLAFMTIFQVLAALLMPALAQRSTDRRPLLSISLLSQVVGYCGLVWLPGQFTFAWVALIGFGLGACFALSLILTLDHRKDPRQAGQLAAFVQGIGFLINATSPWISAWLREMTGSFVTAWVVLAVVCVAMIVLTRIFNPAGYRDHADSEGVVPAMQATRSS